MRWRLTGAYGDILGTQATTLEQVVVIKNIRAKSWRVDFARALMTIQELFSAIGGGKTAMMIHAGHRFASTPRQ